MNKKEIPYLYIRNEQSKQLKKMTEIYKTLSTFEKSKYDIFIGNSKDTGKFKFNFDYINKNIDFMKKEIQKIKTENENSTVKNLLSTLRLELKYWELCKQQLTYELQEKARKDLQNE